MRIEWTTREREEVASKVMELEAQNPKMSFVALIKEAQKVLPEFRRRTIVSSQAVPWLTDAKHQICLERKRKAEQEKEVDTKSVVLDTLVERLLKELPDRLLEPLAEALLQRLGERLLAKPEVRVAEPAAIEVPPIETDLNKIRLEKEKLTKVLVVGVLPNQANELTAEFSGLMNLRYWKEEGPKTLRNLTRSSKAVILMADKISHSIQDTVKRSLLDGSELIVVSGGVSNIKVALEKYYIEKV